MDAAQKPRFWSRWVNFTPALVGHFYIGGDNQGLVRTFLPKEYPDAYRCALLIHDYVKAQLDISLGGNELLWLTVNAD